MSDATPPPPVPSQPANDAAAAAAAAAQPSPPVQRGYDPATDPDDTGVSASALQGDVANIGRGFFRALFDLSFRTFITRRLASVFYLVGLIAIAIGAVLFFAQGIIGGIAGMWFNPGAAISLIIATIVVVPLVTFLAIVLLRFIIEAVVALIAIAENTERTAQNTRD